MTVLNQVSALPSVSVECELILNSHEEIRGGIVPLIHGPAEAVFWIRRQKEERLIALLGKLGRPSLHFVWARLMKIYREDRQTG